MGSSPSHVESGRADLSGHDRRAPRAGPPARAQAGRSSLTGSRAGSRTPSPEIPRRPRAPKSGCASPRYSIPSRAKRDAVGWPTVFVRLTGCPLRCVWCDTEYAFHGGSWRTIAEIVAEPSAGTARGTSALPAANRLRRSVASHLLIELCDAGYEVSLETSGAIDVAAVDARVRKVVDLKAPGSGESARNLWSNLAHLSARDQVKIVIADRADYEWARERIVEHALPARCQMLFSPVYAQARAARARRMDSRRPLARALPAAIAQGALGRDAGHMMAASAKKRSCSFPAAWIRR